MIIVEYSYQKMPIPHCSEKVESLKHHHQLYGDFSVPGFETWLE